jgi:uncharacterized protein with FMN-binding domain
VHRSIPAIASAVALALPTANAWAAGTAKVTPRKKVVTVTRKVAGPTVEVDRWGQLRVTLVVRKTTTTIGKKTTVTRRIAGVSVPVYPAHTDRSVFINEQALPLLRSEVLRSQSATIDLVSGATDTSSAFVQSLQAAILQAKKV